MSELLGDDEGEVALFPAAPAADRLTSAAHR